MQVLENASHHELCLVDAVIQVLLFVVDDLVEIESAQSNWQFESLVLVVVHNSIIVALNTHG
jgi:hypothetical protein